MSMASPLSVVTPTFSLHTPALLLLNQGEEVLGYQTCLGEAISPQTFFVAVHEDSLLFERVCLLGEALVKVVCKKQTYFGHLYLAKNALMLEIGEQCHDDHHDPYLVPHT